MGKGINVFDQKFPIMDLFPIEAYARGNEVL